jgi:hypothetical protein
MSAFKIVQKIPSLTIGSAAGISTSAPISLKSGYLRIVPTQNTFIEVGSTPGISTSTSMWIAANNELILKEAVRSEPVVGIFTGATTTVVFPEGTGSVFEVGDYVELTGITPSGINTSFAQVATVDKNTSYSGYHNTRLTLNWNTSSQSAVTNANGELRKVTKIAAYNDSANPNIIHITEVQVVSNFS